MRKATTDIRFAGWTIPKGWGVRICLREPHRDPAAFVRPDAYRTGPLPRSQPPPVA